MAEVDHQLKQAFAELQVKMQDTRKQLSVGEMNMEAQRGVVRKCSLTKEELANLPNDIPAFKTVGRMFVRQPLSESITDLDTQLDESKKRIDSIQKQKEYLERTLKDSQNNLREMVAQRKNKS